MLITNPPYGERLATQDGLPLLFTELGEVLRARFNGWRACVLAPDAELHSIKVLGPNASGSGNATLMIVTADATLAQETVVVALDQMCLHLANRIENAAAAGVAPGVVLMDASYGTNSALRASIGALALTYVAAILPTVKVRAVADPDERVSAKALALGLPKHAWRTITWRDGSADPLRSRFARVRVRIAPATGAAARAEETFELVRSRLEASGVDKLAGGRAVLVGGGCQLDGVPEVAASIGDRVEVYVDGGIMSGTDVVAALAFGARGVLVGRAYLYGLMAGGEDGVQRAVDILEKEIRTTMQLIGARSVDEVRQAEVRLRPA